MDQPQARALPADMLAQVQVCALVSFGLGDRMVEVGQLVSVSKARANYLAFLRLAEPT